MDKTILKTEGQQPEYALFPLKYEWTWGAYKAMIANFWTPEEISMAPDLQDWNTNKLTTAEQHLFLTVFAQVTTFDLLRTADLGQKLIPHLHAPELIHVLTVQAMQEALHTHSYQHVIETLGLDQQDVYQRYKTVPALANRVSLTEKLGDVDPKHKASILRSLIHTYCVFEGVWFTMNLLGPVQSFARRNMMKGTAEQFQYIGRDEQCVAEGTELLTTKGWLPVEQLTLNDQVAQWHEDGTLSWACPTNLVSHTADHYYEFNLESRGFKQSVSKNHRFPYFTKHGNLKVVTAENATPNPYSKHPVAGELRADGDQYRLTPIERLQIAFQADGHVSDRYNGSLCGTVPAKFYFAKQRKIDRMLDLLGELGWGYQTRHPRDKDDVIFSVDVPITVSLSKDLREVFSLADKPLSWCREFIEEVSHWDGHIVKDNPERIHYSSIVEGSVDFVQSVAALCGYRTKYSRVVDGRSENYSDIHRLHISKHQKSVCGGQIKKIRHDSPIKMYGVEVPSSFILIRDGKNVSVTGNSHVGIGLNLIKDFIREYPDAWNDYTKELVIIDTKEALELEDAFIDYALPQPVLGYNATDHKITARHYAERWLARIGLQVDLGGEHRLGWMDEMVATKKEKNFFETRVTDYQVGSLKFDAEEEEEDEWKMQ